MAAKDAIYMDGKQTSGFLGVSAYKGKGETIEVTEIYLLCLVVVCGFTEIS